MTNERTNKRKETIMIEWQKKRAGKRHTGEEERIEKKKIIIKQIFIAEYKRRFFRRFFCRYLVARRGLHSNVFMYVMMPAVI